MDDEAECESTEPDTSETVPECIEEQPIHKFNFSLELDRKGKGRALEVDVDALMAKSGASEARLFEPLEKAEEGFEVWESGSAKGDE